VAGFPELVTGLPEVVAGFPELVAGYPELAIGFPELVAGFPELVTGFPEVVAAGFPEVVSMVKLGDLIVLPPIRSKVLKSLMVHLSLADPIGSTRVSMATSFLELVAIGTMSAGMRFLLIKEEIKEIRIETSFLIGIDRV
jgi:hypothetical protein